MPTNCDCQFHIIVQLSPVSKPEGESPAPSAFTPRAPAVVFTTDPAGVRADVVMVPITPVTGSVNGPAVPPATSPSNVSPSAKTGVTDALTSRFGRNRKLAATANDAAIRIANRDVFRF